MVKFILSFISLYITIELVFLCLINFLRSEIPWIIIEKDEYPTFSKKKINNFFKKTFDEQLGWNWKAYTLHQEKIFSKIYKISFGKLGERKGVNIFKKKKYNFASFGDSFVFCRYVNNNETWQEQLSKTISSKGLNLGVGNYGLDQIYLKYVNTKIPKNIKTIFIGFVPETLSRCLCTWKHYHEFNNIYAFKPKFINYKNDLKLVENPVKNKESFDKIKKIIKKTRKNEFFYKEKFLKHKFNYPYFFLSLKNPQYNFKLIFYSILNILNFNKNKIYEFIIRENCINNDEYFNHKKKSEIIKKLLVKIKNKSKERGQKVVFLIFPQKHDLTLKKKNYYKFFLNQKKMFDIIDFTEIFEKQNTSKIYLPDQYGGHLTAYGNKVVAETIKKRGVI